ncbi:MAG: histidinol phosphate phosphatase [Acidobacteriota bacterium]|nr:histidinol phosphate phosphatase [Acidobacteriota bacterium]MDE3264918.1 histidinol phosphate phosphatase [Acidobacteriota bacterium]
MSSNYEAELEFAVETAWIAGQLTLEFFRLGVEAELKSDRTPVTEADRGAEELIRSRIAETFPRDLVVGEEFGAGDGEPGSPDATKRHWYVDPIDGTRSFVRGVPLYGILIGLEVDGRVEVGVAHFPGIGETVAAASGQGCTLNGEPAQVRETTSLADGYVSFGDPGLFVDPRHRKAWQRMMEGAAYRVGWSDAYGHALVATGRLELMVDPKMSAWDCGPFPVILREAGGYFGDWDGNETIHGDRAFSTTRRLLPEVLEVLAD